MRRKQKEKLAYYAAWTVVYIVETAIAFLPTVLVGTALVSLMMLERGYFGFGGEWLLIGAFFIGAWRIADIIVQDWLWKKVREMEERKHGVF